MEYIIATDEALQAAAAADDLPASDARAADEGDDDADEGSSSSKKKKGKKALVKDKEYGVSRGVDFQGADTVINFELPADAMMYVSRLPLIVILNDLISLRCTITICQGICTASAARLEEVLLPALVSSTSLHAARQPRQLSRACCQRHERRSHTRCALSRAFCERASVALSAAVCGGGSAGFHVRPSFSLARLSVLLLAFVFFFVLILLNCMQISGQRRDAECDAQGNQEG